MERPLEPVGRAIGYTHRDKGDADCLAHRGVLIASKLGSYRDRGYSDTPRYRSSRASALLRGMWASVGARLARESADRLPLWERCLPAMKATRTVWLTGVFLSRASSAPTGIQFRLGHRVIVHRRQARSYAIWGFRWSEACPRISRLRNPVGAVLARDEGDADCLAHRGVLIASKLGSYRDPVPSGPSGYRPSRASSAPSEAKFIVLQTINTKCFNYPVLEQSQP